jgi:hypothetical protein
VARIRAPRSAGDALAACVNRDSRRVDHCLAPAALFLEGGELPLSTIVGGIVGPFAFTFMATWLFNHTGGSVLMTILLHASEGSVQAEGWVYVGLLMIVAIGLVIFDWKAWRSPAPSSATTPQPDQPQELSPGTAT